MKCLGIVLLSLSALTMQAELPPLISREILFGNPERSHPEMSPDGAQIAWLAPDRSGVLNVWLSTIDGANAHPITNETHRPIQWYTCGGDTRHILYLQDNAGDENDHVFSADLTNRNVRDMTTCPEGRAQH